jgi:hypothetical protein
VNAEAQSISAVFRWTADAPLCVGMHVDNFRVPPTFAPNDYLLAALVGPFPFSSLRTEDIYCETAALLPPPTLGERRHRGRPYPARKEEARQRAGPR